MSTQVNSTTVNDCYLNHNVGYTVFGSPTIMDGVVSGFSSGNLLQISLQVAPQSITERLVKIKFNASAFGSGKYHNVLYGPASMSLVFYFPNPSNGKCAVSCYLPGISQSIYYGSVLESTITNWTWFKYIYDGTTVSLFMSTDGKNYSLLDSKTGSINGSVGNCSIGSRWNGDNQFFDGSIDLNNTYIKVNGITWFNGKQAASPAVNALQINGNTVWQR